MKGNKRDKNRHKKSWSLKNTPYYLIDDGKWWYKFNLKFRCRNKFIKYPKQDLEAQK